MKIFVKVKFSKKNFQIRDLKQNIGFICEPR